MDSLPDAMVAALYRHPVKGLTPEPLDDCVLQSRASFPGDRLYAIEIGPSGFDPDAPQPISKMRFAVLARIPELARVVSRWDETSGRLSLRAPGHGDIEADLSAAEGARTIETWLTEVLGEEATAPLRLLDGRGHRFIDDPRGEVSLLNLASLRALSERVERPLDPLRLRANIHVEGWPAWAENDLVGSALTMGGAQLRVVKPIPRCVAIDVDLESGGRDGDLIRDLVYLYGHTLCGLYLSVEATGRVAVGDPVERLK